MLAGFTGDLPAGRVGSRQPHRVPVSKGVVIVIQPKQSDIGRKVIYRAHNAEPEDGVITRFNAKYVFVRFGKEEKSVVTTRYELADGCQTAQRPRAGWGLIPGSLKLRSRGGQERVNPPPGETPVSRK